MRLFTFWKHPWGWDLKVPFGWLTKSKESGLYFSPDATPMHPNCIRLIRP